jgi:hypothetical protein
MPIKFDEWWNRKEKRFDTTGNTVIGEHPNHESSLSEDEMRSLCMRILRYVDNMNDATKPAQMDKRIWNLAQRLKNDGDVTVRKGIHQRDSKAHFLLQIPLSEGKDVFHSYHVWVAPGGVNGKLPDEARYEKNLETAYTKKEFFQYRPTGIGVTTGGQQMALWPSQFQQHQLEVPLGRTRGTSFSTGNVQSLLHPTQVPQAYKS